MNERPAKSIKDFQPGTIIRHEHGSSGLLVTANYGDYAIAVRTQHIANPEEWLIIEPEKTEVSNDVQ